MTTPDLTTPRLPWMPPTLTGTTTRGVATVPLFGTMRHRRGRVLGYHAAREVLAGKHWTSDLARIRLPPAQRNS